MTHKLIQSEPDISSALDPFWERLRETASWCAPEASLDDPRGCLRSSRTNPRVLEPSYFDAVRAVVNLRIRKKPQMINDPLEAVGLLVYFADAELEDGASGHGS